MKCVDGKILKYLRYLSPSGVEYVYALLAAENLLSEHKITSEVPDLT